MAAPTIRGTFAANALTSNTDTTAVVTLPAGIVDGDSGLLVIGINSATVTMTTPTGWTLEEGPNTNASTTLRSYLFSRTMAASDSSTTVDSTLSATGPRWTMGGIIAAGAVAPYEQKVYWTDNTDDALMSLPAITPTNDDDLLVALVTARWATTTKGVAATNGWAEDRESNTTNGTAPCFGAWVGARTLSGQSGIEQVTVDMTYAANARENGWVVAFAPAPVVIPPRPQVYPSAAVIRASTR